MTSGAYSRTTMLILCGIFAAITAICSLITIPLGFTPVPINLGTLAVFLTGGLLGKKYGAISITVYVLLGATGIPVFSGARGGIGVLAGPTGGYIIGYIAAVLIIGLTAEALTKRRKPQGKAAPAGLMAISMTAGLLVCYALGTAWFMISTSSPLWTSLVSCVIPFLPGDAVKIAIAALLTSKLRPLLTAGHS